MLAKSAARVGARVLAQLERRRVPFAAAATRCQSTATSPQAEPDLAMDAPAVIVDALSLPPLKAPHTMEQEQQQPQEIDYSYFINAVSARRKAPVTREITKLQYGAPKELISLAEGMPSETQFPFAAITVQLRDGGAFTLDGATLDAGLQYIPSNGYPPLLASLRAFTQRVHRPPRWADTELLITSGSQDGISKSIEMAMEAGSPLIVPDPFYTGTSAVTDPHRIQLLPVAQDALGMCPHALERALDEWRARCAADPALRPAKLMYVNPTGANPNGATMDLARRRAIYDVCCRHNVLILEDDAYYFLNYADELLPSFLSLDTQGRVLRFDSFSKCLAPGLRVAWVTGPRALVQRLEYHVMSGYLHSSTLAQVITNTLIEHWGFDRLLEHFARVRHYYRDRCRTTMESMDRHLAGLATWDVPAAGMFAWIKVDGVSDVYDMLLTRGTKKLITFIPGHPFMADPTRACSYIRASFSRLQPAQIDRAMQLLAELIREERAMLQEKHAKLA